MCNLKILYIFKWIIFLFSVSISKIMGVLFVYNSVSMNFSIVNENIFQIYELVILKAANESLYWPVWFSILWIFINELLNLYIHLRE